MNFCRQIYCRSTYKLALAVGLLWNCAQSAVTANYDTAWTFIYDGGIARGKDTIADSFRDVLVLSNGDAVFVGETRDLTYSISTLVVKLSPTGKLVQKKVVAPTGTSGASIILSRSGDYLIGGDRLGAPFLARLDSAFNVHSQVYFYDSIQHRRKLLSDATLQSLVQTKNGNIIAVGGDFYPNGTNDFAVWMEFDSSGSYIRYRQWVNNTPYRLSGWSVAETRQGSFLMGGQQAIAYMDSAGVELGKNKYTFFLKGVGTVTNNVSRVRKLRDGRFLAVGQAYEENCWTWYQRLSFDGWWSLIAANGQSLGWNTAGESGAEDDINDGVQLADGRLAFIGNKGTSPDSGLWVFVTDSLGKTIEWERQYNLAGNIDGNRRHRISAFKIAATADSGFLVAAREDRPGQLNDAVAFKFVPRPLPAAINQPLFGGKGLARWEGKGVLGIQALGGSVVTLRLFDVRGVQVVRLHQIASPMGMALFNLRVNPIEHGRYTWVSESGGARMQGSILAIE